MGELELVSETFRHLDGHRCATRCAWNPRLDLLATAAPFSHLPDVHLWDAQPSNSQPLRSLKHGEGREHLVCLEWSPDGLTASHLPVPIDDE